MPSSMLVHDTRVSGTSPSFAPNTYKVDANVPLASALTWVSQYARAHGGLSRLLILCHGKRGAVEDTRVGLSISEHGFGLSLCREGLTLANVARTAVLKGLVQHIILYACGAARTRPGFANTPADGRGFCSALARFTNASVTAAVERQFYDKRPAGFLSRVLGVGAQDVIDLGPWEGPIYRFEPDGSLRPPCSR